jgi:uncharacterized protein YggE
MARLNKFGLLAVPLLLLSTATGSAQQSQARTISVEGNGSVVVTPDEVVFNLGIKTAHTELQKAKHENDGQARRLLSKLKDLGLTDRQIRTAAVSVSIQYDREEDTKVTAYVVRRAYAIRLGDPKQVEAVIEAALTNGANETSTIRFQSTQSAKHSAEARKIALRNAAQKAEAMARELGCKVGRPISIEDRSRSDSQIPFVTSVIPVVDGDGDVETMLGQIDVSEEVGATFELLGP